MLGKFSQFKNISILFPVAVSIILLSIIFTIVYSSFKETNDSFKPSPQQIKQPQEQEQINPNIAVTNISPSGDTTLIANQKQTFTVSFSSTLDANAVTFLLTPDDDSQGISNPKFILRQVDGKTISLQTQETIEPYNTYTLTIQNRLSQKVLASQSYYVAAPQPTTVQTNSPALQAFLPYETDTYSLEYLSDQNVYLFHFKYNESSDVESDVQFEQAKTAATKFIESKGINISTITIDWRSS